MRGKSGGETDFGGWYYVQDGKDGVGSDGNPLVTRGELIATSGYIPQTANGSMARTVAWTLNSKSGYVDTTPATESTTGTEDKFTVLASPYRGILNVPYKPVTDQVLGLWAVTEDLSHAEGDREIRPTFIPWGVGGLEDDDNPNYFTSRHVIHFGRESASSTAGADVVIVYFTVRNKDYKAQIVIRAYGDSLPSTQCRVKIYLAGAFGSVYEKAGDDGWSPKFATVPHGERRVLQVADWFGGGGTKPDVGQYIGETGFVAAIAEGVDIRGPAGEDGEDGTGICTAHTVLDDADGSEDRTSVQLPTNYTDFDNVYIGVFGNDEFRANTLKISRLVDGRKYRVGGISDIIWTEATRTFRLNDGRANGNFREVILTGCEDDGGTPNPTETLQSGTVSLKATRFAYWKTDGVRRTAPAAGNSEINIGSGGIGHWMQHKNKVFFTFAMLFQTTTDMKQARVYFQPPAGETIANCIGSAAVMGGGEVYGVNVFGADSADADTAQDEIEVSAVAQGAQPSRFPNVIGVSCAYEIVN